MHRITGLSKNLGRDDKKNLGKDDRIEENWGPSAMWPRKKTHVI